MATQLYTETITVDPNAVQTLVNLGQDKDVLEISIIGNTLFADGTRKLTLAILYDSLVTLQHSFSVHNVTLGPNITDVTNTTILDTETIHFTEFVPAQVTKDEVIVSILTFSRFVTAAKTNQFSTQNITCDPDVLLSAVAVTATTTFKESILINTGSLAGKGGTVLATLLMVNQST